MARGNDETTPQSDRERRVLEKDQAELSTELRETGPDHRARGDREAGGAAWEIAGQQAAREKHLREQTGRDVTGQDQRGRPDVELDRQQPTQEQRETQQREQLERQQRAAEAQQVRLDAEQQRQVARQQREHDAAVAQGRDARGRERDALTARDQLHVTADHTRESGREDVKEAVHAERNADELDDPAEERRAQALRADDARKRGVALGDEDQGRAEDAKAQRAAAEARGHEAHPEPAPPPKRPAGGEKNLANEGAVAPAGKIKGAKRGTRSRKRRAGKNLGQTRDRGRERKRF